MARPKLAQPRQRRDYRFSSATLQIIEQGRELTGKTETAFVEAAICHYRDFLSREETEASEVERLRARVQVLEHELVEASRPSHSRPAPTIEYQPPAPVSVSVHTSSRSLPTYQVSMRHEPGTGPDLPEGFDYIDGDRSKGNRRCMNPIHRVFAQPCTVTSARKQVERLQEVAGIVRIWIEDKKGQPLSRDSWRKENGRWVRDD